MQAGDIIRVPNNTDGPDFFYLVNEIQMGDTGCESVVMLQSLSRRRNQSERARQYHQVPLSLLDDGGYELYRAI